MDKSVIIRKENLGKFLYSLKDRCYLSPSAACEKALDIVYENISNGKSWSEGIEERFKAEFSEIGIDNNARLVDNSGFTKRKLFAPLEYYFDYTNACNLRCPHCYNQKHLGWVTMEPGHVRNIISEMFELGVNRIHLAGGEPTINHDGLFNYIKAADEYGIVMSLATNGTLITKELAEEMLDYDLFSVSVSIDGWNEETNSALRGKGFFEKSVRGTKNLIRAKEEKRSRTEICLKPVYDYNSSDDFFENMIKLALAIGVDKIKFANPERSLNHELGHYGKHKKRYYEQIKLVKSLQEKYSGQIKVTNANNPFVGCPEIGIKGLHGCIGAQELITINPDGRITPCLMDDKILGNYFEYGSIKEFLIKSKTLGEYLGEVDNEKCYSCKSYSVCRGGCQVRKIVEYGKITGCDPLCPEEFKDVEKPVKCEKRLFHQMIYTFSHI